MAKKKEEYKYLQSPLPYSGAKKYRKVKVDWTGYNKKNIIDSGELSDEHNISTKEAPYLTPSEKRVEIKRTSGADLVFPNPGGIFAYKNCLFVHNYDDNVNANESFEETDPQISAPSFHGKYGYSYKLQYGSFPNDGKQFVMLHRLMKVKRSGSDYLSIKTGILDPDSHAKDDFSKLKQRSIARFNALADADNPLTSALYRKIIVYPDKMCTEDSFDFDSEISFTLDTFDLQSFHVPDANYATVHQSRVFSVSDNKVWASAYNSYNNYKLGTVLEPSTEASPWYSLSLSNTNADDVFTGIHTFGNHVICFKNGFMHEITNNKYPFRINDVAAEGCIDNRTIQEVDGNLIFVSDKDVFVYTGGMPKSISYKLNIDKFSNCCSGSDGRNYYLYFDGHIYVFDTLCNQWSVQDYPIGHEVVGFAKTDDGFYLLDKYKEGSNYYGKIYKIDTNDYENYEWSFETDFSTSNTVDIKHIQKIQMLADFTQGSSLKVYALYDNEVFNQNSQLVCDINGVTGQYPIRIVTRKTANRGFKLHFEGEGYIKLYSMELIMKAGGGKDVSGE